MKSIGKFWLIFFIVALLIGGLVLGGVLYLKSKGILISDGSNDYNPGELTYMESEDGSYWIVTGIKNPEEGLLEPVLSIPAEYKKKPVKEIGEAAFVNNANDFTTVTVAEGITTIGKDAFKGCISIAELSLPSTVTVIREGAFEGCHDKIFYTDAYGAYVKLGTNPYAAFVRYSPLGASGELVLNEANVLIADGALKGNTVISKVTLGQNLKYLGISAFEGCTAITEIEIPASLSVVTQNAFKDCSALNKVTLHATTKTVEANAFANTALSKIDLSGLKTIGDGAFSATKLTSVTIPAGCALGAKSFADCGALATLNIAAGNTVPTSAFSNSNNIKVVDIPAGAIPAIYTKNLTHLTVNSGSSIPGGAFANCKKLEYVNITNAISSVTANTFSGAGAIKTLVIHQSLLANVAVSAKNSIASVEFTKAASEKKIATDEFEGFTALVNIKLSDEFTVIEKEAFNGFTNLASVKFNKVTEIGDEAFAGCTALSDIQLKGVTKFGKKSFENCRSLKSVEITADVITESLFCGCTALETATLAENTKTVKSYAFKNCTSLVNTDISGLNLIENEAFYNTAFTEIKLSDTVEVKERAFANCLKLIKIEIPAANGKVADTVFGGCSAIENADVPAKYLAKFPSASLITLKVNSGDEIEDNALMNATNLKTVSLPETITKIGKNSFKGCTALYKLNIPSNVTSIGNGAFDGLVYTNVDPITNVPLCDKIGNVYYLRNTDYQLFVLLKASDTTITTLNTQGARFIMNNAFEGCTNLNQVIFSENIRSIGAYAFKGCTALTSINIAPSDNASIDVGVFSGCTGLKVVTLSERVTSIGDGAFTGCNNIETMDVSLYALNRILDQASVKESLTDVIINSCANATNTNSENIPDAIPASRFEDYKKLNSVTINCEIEIIGAYAFKNCEALVSLNIPASVEKIGVGAFDGCTYENLCYNDGDAYYLGNSSNNHFVLVKFMPTTDATSYNVAQNARFIMNNLFSLFDEGDTPVLKVLNIGDNVWYIHTKAFAGCTEIIELNIGIGLKEIAGDAFADSENIAKAVIPAIALDVLPVDCRKTNLKDLTVNIGAISEHIMNFSKLETLVIKNTVTSIGHNAFFSCDSLTSVTIEDRVDLNGNGEPDKLVIGSYAFAECEGLTNITLKNCDIRDHAFYGCDSLKYNIDEASCTVTGDHVFDGAEKVAPATE